MNREEAKEFLKANILSSSEVQELLMITRARLGILVTNGKLKPIKETKRENLFWLSDVEQLKNEMLKDTRSNLYKNQNRS